MGNPEIRQDTLESLFDALFPICRSITGPGLRESLNVISEYVPLETEAVPSGTQVFDWEVPKEWRIHDARLVGPDGTVYADFQRSNLFVVNYSEPVDRHLSLAELRPHLYTDPDIPDAIPYVTSYYDHTWGFCLPHELSQRLPDGEYHAIIDSKFVDGELTYGHTVLEGESSEEVLLSSYLCHPSLANNELSGPLALTALYDRLKRWDDRRYTYRFVLCPETIGSLSYLWRYGDHLKEHLAGGLVLTCLGGPSDRLRYKSSRREDTLLDKLVGNLEAHGDLQIERCPFTPTDGSDERQYCSPGFDLPVGQVARTVYGEYEAYHNSNDDKEFMDLRSVWRSVDAVEQVLSAFEHAGRYRNLEPYGEPMLSKRDLYPTTNSPGEWDDAGLEFDRAAFLDKIMYLLSYSDGTHTAVDIANRYGCAVDQLVPVIETLDRKELLEPAGKSHDDE